MIARIVTGSGRTRRTFALPCSSNRKEHIEARLAVGNTIKSKYLFRITGGGRIMRRVYSRPKGAPINDPRVGQPMWSKPGAAIDKGIKKRLGYMYGGQYSGVRPTA